MVVGPRLQGTPETEEVTKYHLKLVVITYCMLLASPSNVPSYTLNHITMYICMRERTRCLVTGMMVC